MRWPSGTPSRTRRRHSSQLHPIRGRPLRTKIQRPRRSASRLDARRGGATMQRPSPRTSIPRASRARTRRRRSSPLPLREAARPPWGQCRGRGDWRSRGPTLASGHRRYHSATVASDARSLWKRSHSMRGRSSWAQWEQRPAGGAIAHGRPPDGRDLCFARMRHFDSLRRADLAAGAH